MLMHMISTRNALRIGMISIGIAAILLPYEQVRALHDDSYQSREYIEQWKEAASSRSEDREQALRNMAVEFRNDVESKLENARPKDELPVQSRAEENANDNSAVVRDTPAEKSQIQQAPLSDARLKACQNREAAIKNIMTRLSERSTHQLGVFTKIADGAIAFYESSNTSSESYDKLVTEMQTRRVIAEDAVTATHDTSYQFDCENTNPIHSATLFTQQLHMQNDLLKQYKTAVKDLVIEIRASSTAQEDA